MTVKSPMLKNKLKLKLKGIILVLLFKLLALLPLFLSRFLSYLTGHIVYLIPTKTKKTIKANIEICYPKLSQIDKDRLIKQNILHNSQLIFELPLCWLAKDSTVLGLFGKINNKSLIDNIIEQGKPVILAVPHIGNWELFWHWVQLNYSSFGMYSPAKFPEMDKMMINSRQRFGGQAFATDSKGILSLIRRVKQGGVMMILTDQVPKAGSGTYAPFFGHQAYTMTLLYKFLQKTDAELLFGCCLRNDNDKDFNINLFKPSFDTKLKDVNEFNIGMNKQIEEIIQLAPDQYQWSYKRFKCQKDGVNFYKKLI